MRKCRKSVPAIAALILLCQACDYPSRSNFDRTFIRQTPVNLLEVNTEYDDYNSFYQPEEVWGQFTLFFSSNRDSYGDNFNLVSASGEFNIEPDKPFLNLYIWPYGDEFIFNYEHPEGYQWLSLNQVNTDHNELGPYAIYNDNVETWHDPSRINNYSYGYQEPEHRRFFYASDAPGHFDIVCVYAHEQGDEEYPLFGHDTMRELNSPYNDAYPSIYTGPQADEILFFTTDREDSDFDIYQAKPIDNRFINLAKEIEIQKLESLSTDSEDKCPFVHGTKMVFTSNRPGGQGGFDLYYSTFDGQSWSEPVNFGSPINTEYDEYRPIIVDLGSALITDELMFFSSNRPGGKGGYDLYYVGIRPN